MISDFTREHGYGPYKVHPFADKFPLIEDEEFDALVADIQENGLLNPILLSPDMNTIIDGRNRYRACIEATTDPRFETLDASYDEVAVLDLIVTLNIQRRHLSAGDKGFLALDYAAAVKEATAAREARRKENTNNYARKEPSDLGKMTSREPDSSSALERQSLAKAAKVTGASRDGAYRAQAIRRDTPDLEADVLAHRLSIDEADKQRKQRIQRQPKPEVVKPSPVMLTLLTHKGEEVPYPKPQGRPEFNQSAGDGISWAQWSWNPVTGCLHGCKYCYAREIATSERFKSAYPAGFTPLFHSERLNAPKNTVIPAKHADDEAWKRVFVCSMADLYGRWVPDAWISQVHEAMLASPQWQYITLTKFPDRYKGLVMPPNAWVGTSVDEQKRVRIAENAFREVEGVAVKWLSLEPLLEPLEFTDLSMFDWVVIGGQTATHQPDGPVPAFAPEFDWVARIYLQAKEAGCKVHLKPNLKANPGMNLPNEYPEQVSHTNVS